MSDTLTTSSIRKSTVYVLIAYDASENRNFVYGVYSNKEKVEVAMLHPPEGFTKEDFHIEMHNCN